MILGREVCPKALEDAIRCRPEPPEPALIEIVAVSRNAHALLLKLVPEGLDEGSPPLQWWVDVFLTRPSRQGR